MTDSVELQHFKSQPNPADFRNSLIIDHGSLLGGSNKQLDDIEMKEQKGELIDKELIDDKLNNEIEIKNNLNVEDNSKIVKANKNIVK